MFADFSAEVDLCLRAVDDGQAVVLSVRVMPL